MRGEVFAIAAGILVVVLDQVFEDLREEVVALPQRVIKAEVHEGADQCGAERVALVLLDDEPRHPLEQGDAPLAGLDRVDVRVVLRNAAQCRVEPFGEVVLPFVVEQVGQQPLRADACYGAELVQGGLAIVVIHADISGLHRFGAVAVGE